MEGRITHLWWDDDPDTPNPVSGLSRRDVDIVKRDWNVIYANAVPNGTELLKRYFRAYPEAKKFFVFVSKLTEEDYDTNARFKAHVLNLMGALESAVQHLHDPEVAAALMVKTGESHRKRAIKKQYFNDIKEVFLKMLAEVMKLDNMALQSWGRAIDFLFNSIFTSLEHNSTTAEGR